MDNKVFSDLMGYSTEDVAEESVKEMQTLFKDKKPVIDDLIKEAKASKDDPKNMLKCYKEALDLLEDLKQELSGIDNSKLDNGLYNVGYAATIIGEIIAMLKLNKTVRETQNLELDCKKALAINFGGSIGIGAVAGKAQTVLKQRKNTKKIYMDSINQTQRVVKAAIRKLESKGYGATESLVEYFSTMEVATEADNQKKSIPQRIIDIVKRIGEYIKKLIEKIKFIFTKTSVINVPTDVYKEGQEIDNLIINTLKQGKDRKSNNIQEVMQRVEAFKQSGYRIGDGKKRLQPIKTIPLPEAKIIAWTKQCQERYNKRAEMLRTVQSTSEYANHPVYGARAQHLNQTIDNNYGIERLMEDMKLLQYELVIYSHYLSYAAGKQTVE